MSDLRERLQDLYKKKRVVGLSAEDAERLPDYLEDSDLKFRFFVGDLIRRNAKGSVESLIFAAATDSEEVRRSAVHLLGKICRELNDKRQAEIAETIETSLKDPDPKVRRNATIALGDLKDPKAIGSLAETLSVEPFEWVRSSMILALGQIGGPKSAAVLERVNAKSDLEDEALTKARDRVAVFEVGESKRLHAFPEEREIELRSAPGLEDVLCAEFVEISGREPKVVQTGSARVTVRELNLLSQVRTWREWLIPVGERDLADRSESDFAHAGLELLVEGLETFAAIYGKQEHVSRYRIEVRGRETSHESRRKLIKHWVVDLEGRYPDFANSPSHYEAELRLQRAKTKASLYLKLTCEVDTRFDYRVADVPAAMQPATAAGVVRLACPQKGASRVLDPFCGSGTLLFERAHSGMLVGERVGSDVSGNAISAAQANLDHSTRANLSFLRGDVRSIRLEGRFDELISNLPYGIRTGSHDKNVDVYRTFIDRLPEWMNDGASITLVTQEMDLMKDLFNRSNHLSLSKVHRIDTGGLQPGVFVGMFRN